MVHDRNEITSWNLLWPNFEQVLHLGVHPSIGAHVNVVILGIDVNTKDILTRRNGKGVPPTPLALEEGNAHDILCEIWEAIQ